MHLQCCLYYFVRVCVHTTSKVCLKYERNKKLLGRFMIYEIQEANKKRKPEMIKVIEGDRASVTLKNSKFCMLGLIKINFLVFE